MAMKRLAVVLADFVNGADVGMIQRRCGPGFALEAFQGLRVLRDFVGQELQRDEAAERGVFGLVDHAHAAAAQFFDDAVVRDGLADHELGPCYVGYLVKSMKADPVALKITTRFGDSGDICHDFADRSYR